MADFKQHYFVCTNSRPPFAKPSCGPRGANEILAKLKEEVEKNNFTDIKVTACGCLGPCEEGTVIVVYPEGTWYRNVMLSDVSDLVEIHMKTDHPVERLLYNSVAEPK